MEDAQAIVHDSEGAVLTVAASVTQVVHVCGA